MKTIFFFLIPLFITTNAVAQNTGLANLAFVSSFISDTFTFDKVHPLQTADWQLIAGMRGNEKYHTQEETDSFERFVDSSFRADMNEYTSKSSICSERIKKECNKCLKKNYKKKNKIKYCDSLSSRWGGRDSICYEVNIMENPIEKRESLLNNFRYTYSIDYNYKSGELIDQYTREMEYCGIREFYGTWCPPGGCSWFILSLINKKIQVINDSEKLFNLLGSTDDPYKAYFMLAATQFGYSGAYPQDKEPFKYKKIGNKFYFIKSIRLSDCPVQNYICLISVDKNGDVNIVEKIKDGEEGGCI